MANIREYIDQSSRILSSLVRHTGTISEIAEIIAKSIEGGHKLLIFGNGGSAAQAQHMAAELIVRFEKDRQALPAIALTTDTSILSAAANDYGFEHIFSRQLEALACQGDVVVALSTSGDSPNVVRAIEKAKELKLKTVALLGKDGGKLKGKTDIEIIVESHHSGRIQEAHLLILHIIAETVESDFSEE